MAVIRDALGNPIFDDVQSLNTVLSTLGADVTLDLDGQSCAAVQVEAIGTMTLVFEGSVDGTDFFPVFGVVPGTGAFATSTTTDGIWIFEVGAFTKFRVRVSLYTSGTVSVSAKASQGTTVVQLAAGSITATIPATVNQGTPAVVGNAWPVKITDGVDTALVSAGGALSVDIGGAGTIVTQDTASKVDDAAFTPAVDRVLMVGAEADETAPDAVDEGDAGALRMTLNRGLHANLRNAAGTEIATAATPARVDPTGTTAQPVTDNAGSLTVDGTVTADQGTAAAAVGAWPTKITDGVDTVDVTAASALKVDGSAVTQSVSAASLPLPTGASTLAGQTQPGVDIGDVTVNNAAGASAVNIQDGGNSITIDGTITATADGQAADGAAVVGNPVRIGGKDGGGLTQDIITDATGVLAVQDNGGSLTVDSPQLPAVLAAGGGLKIEGVAGGVVVPISAASLPLPTGASTLAGQTQPGVDIGDVTINNAAGAAAVNVQDGGNSLTVDGSISITGAVDTELPAAVALADNTANPTVPGVGAFLMAFDGTNWDRVQTGAAAGGALKVDGSAVTQPVSAASLPLPTGASTLAGQTQPGVDIGDVTVNNAAGASAVNVQDGGNSLTVDGTVAISGSVDTELPAAAALADAAANPTAPAVGAFSMVWNGATWDRLTGSAGNGVETQGSVANAVADAGNPVGVGAQARTTNPTAVTDGQRVTLKADKLGRLVVVQGQIRELAVQNTITLTSTTETTLIAAGAAGVFHDVSGLILTNTSATGVRVDFRDTTAGTVRFSIFLAASGGGAVVMPNTPFTQTTAALNWTAQLSAAVTDVRIFAQAIKNL